MKKHSRYFLKRPIAATVCSFTGQFSGIYISILQRLLPATLFLMIILSVLHSHVPVTHAFDRIAYVVTSGQGFDHLSSNAARAWVESLVPADQDCESEELTLEEPADGTIYPSDMSAPPIISWKSTGKQWLVSINDGNQTIVRALCAGQQWVPRQQTWEKIKTYAGNRSILLMVDTIGGWDGRQLIPGASAEFRFSKDPVASEIFYLSMPVPFRLAQVHPQMSQWRLGNVSTPGPGPVVMENQKVCGNCHTFSLDGSTIGLDMDIDGDKGAFLFADIDSHLRVRREDVISWNTIQPPAPATFSFGLFTQLSPDGRHALSTVGETSLFVMMDDPVFSQLFFPVTGRIAWYDRNRNRYSTLPGADMVKWVQTGPAWSPDGKRVLFSRAEVNSELVEAVLSGKVNKESSRSSIMELNKRYPIQFDIWEVPFNDGNGGEPVPLAGASGNGKSNFFPRFSPDGKWIVFTQSPTGLVLQPASELWIVPAEGGGARRLDCNTPVMNSWHSWSANSRWLVFTGKTDDGSSRPFLTHIDDDGYAGPAIRLHDFGREGFACVLPEFVPPGASSLKSMGLAFNTKTKTKNKVNER